MTASAEKLVVIFLFAAILSGSLVDSLTYDYSSSIECLAEPLKPQYGGGIVRNPEFNRGLKGWSTFGNADITEKTSKSGNQFSVARGRDQPYQALSQKIFLQKGNLYTFSAWVQVNEGSADVVAVFKTAGDFIHAGVVEARSGCWSFLKGGLSSESDEAAEFYFESKNTTVEIWIDSVSLQPFTEDQWRAHQSESINKVRKKSVRFQAVDSDGNVLPNATISVQQKRPGFPFGSAITAAIINNPAYQSWFASRFTVTVFENEMKWYSTERSQGKEDYTQSDAMVAFAKQHRIAIRGHNILWDDPQYQMNWVRSLSSKQLWDATNRRVYSVVSRYRGQLIAWDVVNEDLHFAFFENKLGASASNVFYQKAREIDPNTLMFLNDYNTLEQPGDGVSTPAKYLQKLRQIQLSGAKMAIGLEGHFSQPNIPYMRSALDTLAAGTNVPIWLTEVDVIQDPKQAQYLDAILREAYSHPAVQGILMWSGWHQDGNCRMCLTDSNFKNHPTGDVVDKLISEWKTGHVVGTTDADGFFEAELFHGEYETTISHPSANSSSVRSLNVDAGSQSETALFVQVQA